MPIKIERVLVRANSRQSFTFATTWNIDGRCTEGAEMTLTLPPEALWAMPERLIQMISEGVRTSLARYAETLDAPSFKMSPELEAVNRWEGEVTLDEPIGKSFGRSS